MEYTSYERVKTALEPKEPDRVPFDLGGTCVTGINTIASKNLQAHLGLSEEQVMWDKITQLARTPDDLFERFQVDVKNVGPESPMGNSQDFGLQGDHYRLIDEFGIGWQMPVEGGHYYDLYLHPLKDAETVQDIEKFPWPDPLDPTRYVNLKARVDQVVYEEKKAYVAGRMSAGMWENAIWMCGYEKFLTDMLLNKKLIHAIMSKFLEIKMKYWEKYWKKWVTMS